MEESPPIAPKTTLSAPSLSPIKKKAKGLKDEALAGVIKDAEKEKSKGFSYFFNVSHKNKLFKYFFFTEKEPEKAPPSKTEKVGAFHNIIHYMKLYDVLNATYNSYKVNF